jgi:hypothetical protein
MKIGYDWFMCKYVQAVHGGFQYPGFIVIFRRFSILLWMPMFLYVITGGSVIDILLFHTQK